MLECSDSRALDLVYTEHLNTQHPPLSTDFRLGLLLSQTTHSPMAFNGFNPMDSFLQVKPCTEALSLHQTETNKQKNGSSLVELGEARIPAPPRLQSAPPWCPKMFFRALGLLWNTVGKPLDQFLIGPFPPVKLPAP